MDFVHTLARFFNDGGTFMWVLLVVFAISWAVAIERIIYYFLICRGDGDKLVSSLVQSLNNNDIDVARKTASKRATPMFVLVATAIERYAAGMNVDEIQEGLDKVSIKEIPKLSQRLNYLSLFANIGTLLGLLGTIIGLQTLFASLATVEAAKKAAMLARGISEAMNTTAFGLIVAIPAMVMYTFLYNKYQRLLKDLDESVVAIMLHIRKKKA